MWWEVTPCAKLTTLGRYGERYRMCSIWWLSVKWCEFGEWGKFVLAYWLEVLPLQYYTVWHCADGLMYRRRFDCLLQVVYFRIPSFIDQSKIPKKVCLHGVGYRHMCRFHAKTLYEQPILTRLQYIWRLDDDSCIMAPIGYDVFRLMRDRHIQYGYIKTGADRPLKCIINFHSNVSAYVRKHGITPKMQWSYKYAFYNNFELSDLNLWRSPEYQDYIDYIDRIGGIFYHRWGDATIKTVAVTLLLSKKQIYRFKGIAYKHGRRLKFRYNLTANDASKTGKIITRW